MSLLNLGLFVFSLFSIALQAPLENTKMYSVATGNGNLFRPGFSDEFLLDGYPMRVLRSPDVLDTEYLNKRSAALGRKNFRPGKRSMAVGRSGFRPGKRSIATGRSIFRPGKRSDFESSFIPGDDERLDVLTQIIQEHMAENQEYLKKFGETM
ncbi:hypothetical protein FO519_004745 [Halicephalobus sp. NKZ332]|nr:hypothetical protein FO519_004745 [Halicephalobus sp. NKZ332]